MEAISVFDIFKIGIGPSSSHTMGPWRAAQRFLEVCRRHDLLDRIERVQVDLYGSLAKTGKGHGTRFAVMLGLMNEDPETFDPDALMATLAALREHKQLTLSGTYSIAFDPEADLTFHIDREPLPFHPNGLTFTAFLSDGASREETYYSIGGGFVIQEDSSPDEKATVQLPMPITTADELRRYCQIEGMTIPGIVRINERAWRPSAEVRRGLLRIWETMKQCMHRGCRQKGTLPGGLDVVRRAAAMHEKLLAEPMPSDPDAWIDRIRKKSPSFRETLKWVSCFALAVNEENAAYGRVVTAPTNGAAGVIPAVLMYYVCFCDGDEEGVLDFLLTAGELGSLFKKGATISAAMGGCQAEIGVSSAMAAAALTQGLGGSVEQVLMAAEIAMEHHLGLTCDPVGGLVQVPCIERNAMGALKAITACNLALETDPTSAKVPLDTVIRSMWETALDMNTKYKETSEGGLALHIPVNVAEC